VREIVGSAHIRWETDPGGWGRSPVLCDLRNLRETEGGVGREAGAISIIIKHNGCALCDLDQRDVWTTQHLIVRCAVQIGGVTIADGNTLDGQIAADAE
jgi:hypothetical protein